MTLFPTSIGLPWAGSGLVHTLAIGVGMTVAGVLFVVETRRRKVHDQRVWFLVGMCLFGGTLGARLGTWVRHLDLSRNDPLMQQWLYGNRSIIGGLTGAWLAVILGKRLVSYRVSTGNLFAAPIAAGMAVGRVGCLLTEPPGTPTGGRWGIVLTHRPSLTSRRGCRRGFASLSGLRDRLSPGGVGVVVALAPSLHRLCVARSGQPRKPTFCVLPHRICDLSLPGGVCPRQRDRLDGPNSAPTGASDQHSFVTVAQLAFATRHAEQEGT